MADAFPGIRPLARTDFLEHNLGNGFGGVGSRTPEVLAVHREVDVFVSNLYCRRRTVLRKPDFLLLTVERTHFERAFSDVEVDIFLKCPDSIRGACGDVAYVRTVVVDPYLAIELAVVAIEVNPVGAEYALAQQLALEVEVRKPAVRRHMVHSEVQVRRGVNTPETCLDACMVERNRRLAFADDLDAVDVEGRILAVLVDKLHLDARFNDYLVEIHTSEAHVTDMAVVVERKRLFSARHTLRPAGSRRPVVAVNADPAVRHGIVGRCRNSRYVFAGRNRDLLVHARNDDARCARSVNCASENDHGVTICKRDVICVEVQGRAFVNRHGAAA